MKLHNRRSIRLKGYDYSQSGAYFVTICTQNRDHTFGDIINDQMVLNDYGKIVDNEWIKTTEIRKNIILDDFIVMPNHIHGIIIIDNDTDTGRGVLQYAPTGIRTPITMPFRSPSQTIGAIVRGFKSSATKQINIMRNTPNIPVWQRNYYERIIRDENELNRVRKYIIDNPMNWMDDRNLNFVF